MQEAYRVNAFSHHREREVARDRERQAINRQFNSSVRPSPVLTEAVLTQRDEMVSEREHQRAVVHAFCDRLLADTSETFGPPSPPVARFNQDTTQDDEEEEEATFESDLEGDTTETRRMGECEAIFKQNNNSMQLLLAMALGLRDSNGRLMADTEEDELYKAHLTKSFVPKVPQLKAEMKRRTEKKGNKFRKNSALKPECYRWLKANPVEDPKDIAFLKCEERKVYATLMEMAQESEAH